MMMMMMHTKKVQYSPGRVICQKFLQEGCCETFIEVFNLIKSSRALRKEAESMQERSLPVLLENQLSMLKTIGGALAKAEKSRQSGNESLDYELRLRLGHTFSVQKEDTWMAEYFYRSSYKAISRAKPTDGRKMIQALERLGYIKESKGAVQEALNLLEEAFQLAEKHGLEMTDVVRQSLYLITHRICMTLGQNSWEKEQRNNDLKNVDPRTSEAFNFFKKAHEMAVFADTKECQAAAHAKIGEVMLSLGKYEAAIRHFKTFLDICEDLDDKLGMGNGYLALSAAYENMEDIEMAMNALQQCRELAVYNSLYTVLVPCCIAMGKLETELKNYDEAYHLFQTAYTVLKSHKEDFIDYHSVQKLVRVLCGVGKAHLHFGEYTEILSECTVPALMKVIKWKSSGIGFGDVEKQNGSPESTS